MLINSGSFGSRQTADKPQYLYWGFVFLMSLFLLFTYFHSVSS